MGRGRGGGGEVPAGCGIPQWQLSYPNSRGQSPGDGCLLGTHLYVPGPLWSPLPEMVSGPAGHEAGPREWGAVVSGVPLPNSDVHLGGSFRHEIFEMTAYVQ